MRSFSKIKKKKKPYLYGNVQLQRMYGQGVWLGYRKAIKANRTCFKRSQVKYINNFYIHKIKQMYNLYIK